MDFGFTEEQDLLRKTARDFLTERAPLTLARDVMEGPAGWSPELWRSLAELGWTGLVFPESCGGAGLGEVELVVILEELGRALAPVPLLPTLVAGFAVLEAGDEEQRGAWLPRLASGELRATLALAEAGGRDEPAATQLSARREGGAWRLSGEKLFVPHAACADLLVVVARAADEGERGLALFAVPRETPGLRVEPMPGMDLLRPLSRVALEGVELADAALLGGDADAGATLRRVLDRALVMLCAEMVGGAEKCLEDAVEYAKQRVQFGRPIGVNQAIKHKCADMLLQVESARAICHYAAWAAAARDEGAPLAAAMAKAYASEAYRRVAAENIQIHGGVGFTWEFDCHLYLKRAKSDEVWLGDAAYHRERVAHLLAV